VKLPGFLLRPLANWLIGRFESGKLAPHRSGDIVSSKTGELYMRRGWVIQPSRWTGWWGARVHHTVRNDSDRHLHCHPWPNASLILRDRYVEVMPVRPDQRWEPSIYDATRESTKSRLRAEGDVVFRKATDRHALTGITGGPGCWSLFIVGPKQRKWGFHTAQGFVPFDEYLGIEDESS